MTDMERLIEQQVVEGEIGLVIDYKPGAVLAVDVLQAAMGMISALDKLDASLLSAVDTSLEPVSVLNDVQHSSLKLLLARGLRKVPDELLGSLDWKKWVGGLLVKGKHRLLQKLDADAPEVQRVLDELAHEYGARPAALLGHTPPNIVEVMDALDGVSQARNRVRGQRVTVQTEYGDIDLPDTSVSDAVIVTDAPGRTITNSGEEFFKVKSPDLLGAAQWTFIRDRRTVRVDMLHKSWVEAYHRREHTLLPGDSLHCRYSETVTYDAVGNELERRLAIVEVLAVCSPPGYRQEPLI